MMLVLYTFFNIKNSHSKGRLNVFKKAKIMGSIVSSFVQQSFLKFPKISQNLSCHLRENMAIRTKKTIKLKVF